MKIIIKSVVHKLLETITLEHLNNNNEIFNKISSIKEPIKVEIFVINESITSHQLLKYKI